MNLIKRSLGSLAFGLLLVLGACMVVSTAMATGHSLLEFAVVFAIFTSLLFALGYGFDRGLTQQLEDVRRQRRIDALLHKHV